MLSQAFTRKKRAIIDQLNAPDDRYQDASPKGTVDEGVRTLLDQINDIESLVSTSSCAGRVSVFVGGRGKSKSGVSYGDGHQSTADNKTQDSFQSGKGGGKWTFVSHEPVILPDETQGSDHHFHDLFNMISSSEKKPLSINDFPLMHFKFEPMVLHIMTASLQDAQYTLSAALDAGFRESGAVSLESLPIVAVRSTGLMLDSVLGYETEDGRLVSLVSEAYLHSLVQLANERFRINAQRIERFRSGLLSRYASNKDLEASQSVETSEQRKERKRREGLLRQQQLRQTMFESQDPEDDNFEAALAALG